MQNQQVGDSSSPLHTSWGLKHDTSGRADAFRAAPICSVAVDVALTLVQTQRLLPAVTDAGCPGSGSCLYKCCAG